MVTSHGGLRERRKALTRQEITEAAVNLFERQGFDATTVEEIAAAADVSPRTFFRYFESKVEILLPQEHGDDDEPGVEELVAARPADESPIEALHQVFRHKLGDVVEHGDLAVRQYRLLMATPELRSLALEHIHDHTDEFAQMFANRLGVPADALEPQLMAAAVTGAMWTVMDHWVAEGADAKRLLPIADEAFDLLKRGLQ